MLRALAEAAGTDESARPLCRSARFQRPRIAGGIRVRLNGPASALSTALHGMFGVLFVKGAVLAFALVAHLALDGQLAAIAFVPVGVVTSAMALYTLRSTAAGLLSVM